MDLTYQIDFHRTLENDCLLFQSYILRKSQLIYTCDYYTHGDYATTYYMYVTSNRMFVHCTLVVQWVHTNEFLVRYKTTLYEHHNNHIMYNICCVMVWPQQYIVKINHTITEVTVLLYNSKLWQFFPSKINHVILK